jgi:uncharacterized membrane-anchored protein
MRKKRVTFCFTKELIGIKAYILTWKYVIILSLCLFSWITLVIYKTFVSQALTVFLGRRGRSA